MPRLIPSLLALTGTAAFAQFGLYPAIVKKKTRAIFQLVNEHRYEEVLTHVSPVIKHRFGGNHSLGGERNTAGALHAWFKRLGTVMPALKLTVNKVTVRGGPWNTDVFAEWTATATLVSGESYHNRGVHVINMQWGKVTSIDAHEDALAVSVALDKQYESGIKEAKAPKIES
ncbi:MAG: nuclear transport factor 2 family protein [Hymenobacter sp.]|nr:nuclear transport factor 2 family protein [Hymenobacter sp.]